MKKFIVIIFVLFGVNMAQAMEILQPKGSYWEVLKTTPTRTFKVNCENKNKLCDTNTKKRKNGTFITPK